MMGELVYLMVYLATELINCILAFVLIFGANVTKSKSKIVVGIVTTLIIHYTVLFGIDLRASCAISFLTMIIVPFVFFEKIEGKFLLIYPFVALGTSIIAVSVSFILAIILQIPEYMIAEGNWYTVICQSVPMIVLIIVSVKRKLDRKEPYEVNLGIKQYILFYLVVVSLFFMMASIQSFSRSTYSEVDINIIGCTTSIACIVLVIVTIWQGIIVKREIELKEKNQLYEQYLLTQREYYEELLQQEEKMRRFRHDMNAHMTALQTYADNEEIENIQEYLNQIVSESAMYQVERYTGNKIVDAVIRQLVEEGNKQGVSIEVQGKLLEETATKSYDLCTILSNLLKNAIEACEKIENRLERKVMLRVAMYHGKTYIISKNNVSGKVVMKGKYPKSTKANTVYHGLGYGNIEYVINKYKGTLECRTTEEYFEVEIGL